MGLAYRIGERLSRRQFVRKAIEDRADLGIFKNRPGSRVWFGLFVVGLSYILGWPAVAVWAVAAAHFKEPLLFAIGGPLTYGFSHVLFWIGVFLAGMEYIQALTRWAGRAAAERLMKNK